MKRKNTFNIFLIILPILDLFTSLTSRFFPNIISLGMIIKGLVIILSVIYVLFYSVSKHRKNTIFFYLILLIYFISYFLFKKDLLNTNYLLTEFSYLFKFSYFPIMFFFAINYYDSYEFKKRNMNFIILITLIIYVLLITIPTMLNINFNSYSNASYAGSVGWFYSANEVSTILLLLFPVIYIFLDKYKIITIILFIISLFTISLIGTKVTLFGIIIITFLYFIKSLICYKNIKDYRIMITFLMFIITIMFMFNNKSSVNLQNTINNEEEIIIIDDDFLNRINIDKGYFSKIIKTGIALLSDRDKYALSAYSIYDKTYNSSYPWFGMGFSNSERINNEYIEKLVEIDFLDIFFHMGLLALIILLFPFIYIINILICNYKKRVKLNINCCAYLLIILLIMGVSLTAGHVFLAPAVSIYIIIYLLLLLNELNIFNNKLLNNKKISILALHLGYGGVENVSVNKASMLAKEYDVEIVSLYKQNYDIPYNLNKNVKVTYLMNTVSNKEEFITSLKRKQLFKVIKEGFKSIYILINKKLLIIKYIVKSDAKIIISTRIEFSKLLNTYGKDNVIKIHEQHVYDISDKYINKLDKLKYIDYIMPVSRDLEANYLARVKNKEKIKYIPLSLNYYPKDNELSKLDNKNIIAIGRLDKIKGFADLILIMKELIKKDKGIFLNIFGDGKERHELEELINKYNLNNNVKLFGFKNQIYIKKYLQDTSLYAMTSLEESFGLSVLEAMSFGIPCIAYDSAQGVLDFVNEDNGFIINGRNEKEYVDKIQTYFSLSITKRNIIGMNARESSKKYNFKNVQKEWLEFLKIIVNKRLENNYIMDKLKKIYNNDKIFYFKELQNNLKLKEKKFIITVNPEIIMQSKNDDEIRDIFDNSYSFVPDGIAIVKACNLLNISINERIAGIEIAEFLLKEANNKKYSIYLFGAEDKVLNDLVKIINENYPFIKILGYRNGYVNDKEKVMQEIINLQPDICMVALGVPNQEKIIHKYYKKASKGIFIGVGGSFDVLSGNKRRAPKIFIKLNLEWFYRIFKEPFRIKRFLKYNIKFYLEVVKFKKKIMNKLK